MRKFALLLTLTLTACASLKYEPQVGMTISELNGLAYINCGLDKKNGSNSYLQNIGDYKNTPGILILRAEIGKYADKACSNDIYVYDGKVINLEEAEALSIKHLQGKRKIAEINDSKRVKLNEFISNNGLTTLDDYKHLKENSFRIYRDKEGKTFYSKNYEIVSAADVQSEIYRHLENVEAKIKYDNEMRIIAEKDEVERKKQELERNKKDEIQRIERAALNKKIEAFENARKNIDLIAQVLNYSTGIGDQGSRDRYWLKSESQPCVYTLQVGPSGGQAALLGLFTGLNKTNNFNIIDINTLDPRSVRFEPVRIKSHYSAKQNDLDVIKISINDKIFFLTPDLDLQRLVNGWGKVFSGNCKGNRRSF